MSGKEAEGHKGRAVEEEIKAHVPEGLSEKEREQILAEAQEAAAGLVANPGLEVDFRNLSKNGIQSMDHVSNLRREVASVDRRLALIENAIEAGFSPEEINVKAEQKIARSNAQAAEQLEVE